MSIQSFYSAPTSQHHYSTHFNFEDLDAWVNESHETDEYALRFELATQILECHNRRSISFIVEGSNLTSLPKAIGSLLHLRELTIGAMPITSLPAEIGNLVNLERLLLYTLEITSLPPEIGNLNIYRLEIENTPLSSLPREIGQCSNLNKLLLRDNALTSLPPEIGYLQQLEKLILIKNHPLSYLPEEICQLQNLEVLDLEDTSISYLPLGIFHLENLRSLYLAGCPFSENALIRLQTHIENPAYPDRNIVYTRNTGRVTGTTDRPLDELLQELYKESGQESSPLLDQLRAHPCIEDLRLFLGRLAYTVDFERGSDEKKAALAEKITGYLALAEEDPNYRERFFACLNDAATTCGDRVSLTIIFLGLEKRLAQANFKNLQALYELLTDVWAIHMIINIAHERLSNLTAYESIEVYLGYLTKLGEWHNLPLDVNDMHFFKISEISPLNLHTASQQLERDLNNQTKKSEFLANHDLWRGAIDLKYPPIYKQIMKAENPIDALAQFTRDVLDLQSFAISQQDVNDHPEPPMDPLERWLNSCNIQERARRFVAIDRIMKCKQNQSSTLNLRGLGLTSLPLDTINTLYHVRRIDLKHNDIPVAELNKLQLQRVLPDAVSEETLDASWSPY